MSEKDFQKKMRALEAHIAEFEAKAYEARRELADVKDAYRVFLSIKGKSKSAAKKIVEESVRPTKLVEIVPFLLSTVPSAGLTRAELFEILKSDWRPDLELRSLTSTLNNLRVKGVISNSDRRWRLTAKGKKSG